MCRRHVSDFESRLIVICFQFFPVIVISPVSYQFICILCNFHKSRFHSHKFTIQFKAFHATTENWLWIASQIGNRVSELMKKSARIMSSSNKQDDGTNQLPMCSRRTTCECCWLLSWRSYNNYSLQSQPTRAFCNL